MKLNPTATILFAHLGTLLAGALLFGGFTVDGFVISYAAIAFFLSILDLLVILGLAFDKHNRKYIPVILLCIGLQIITGLFAASQIAFSR